MSLLIPPKTPFKLAIYSFTFFFVLTIVWTVFRLPNDSNGTMTGLLFGFIGYIYGRKHATKMTVRTSLLSIAYFTVFLSFFRSPLLITTLMESVDRLPKEEVSGALPILIGALVVGMLLGAFFYALMLYFGAKFGAAKR